MNENVQVLCECRDKLQKRVDDKLNELAPALEMGILSQADVTEKTHNDKKLLNALAAAIEALSQTSARAADGLHTFNKVTEPIRNSAGMYECPQCGSVYGRKPHMCYNGCKRRFWE